MEKENIRNKNKIEMPKKYFDSFDYLRVFFALSIVAWHTKIFGPTTLVTSHFSFNLKEFFYGNIFLVAVPVFAQISLFLYLYNRETKKNYFSKRIIHLATLYVFWISLIVLLFYGAGSIPVIKTPEFWLSGGRTPLYFLVVLMITTIITEIFLVLKKYLKNSLFIAFCFFSFVVSTGAILFKTSLLPLIPGEYWQIFMSHWSPINFIPYIFTSFIFLDLYNKDCFKRKNIKFETIISLIVIAIIIYFEYKLLPSLTYLKYEMIIPSYSRLSIVLSTVLVMYIFLNKNYDPPKIIKFLSGYTLGIYILHLFVMNLFASHFPHYYLLIKESFYYFIFVLLVAFGITYFIKSKKII